MRSSTQNALLVVCSTICMNILCVSAAGAESVTYDYRGNKFVELEGEPGVFSTHDRVTGRFTLNCNAAHFDGTCANLPYENHFVLGAVEFGSLNFSAGPATLPTEDGNVDINAFSFSTDANGQILDWDIDLSFFDPSGIINVDTDNHGPTDSAAALGGGGVVVNDPGTWKTVGSPGKRSSPMFDDRSRIYGNWAGGSHCLYRDFLTRCWDIQVNEHYDVHGTFEYVDIGIYNYFYRYYPDTGGWLQSDRFLSCPVDQKVISAHPNGVTVEATLDADSPGCTSYGQRVRWDPTNGYEFFPYEFFGLTEVSGEWIDPMNNAKSVINRKEEYYDPWSGTTSRVSQHCNESWGDMMSEGGFSISGEAPHSQASFLFEGYDPSGSTWSSFGIMSCNEGNKQH